MNNRITTGTARWYVLEFSAVRFRAVFNYLKNLNADWYCPMRMNIRQRTGRIKSYTSRECPLFPGYLFIRIDFNILHSTHVTRLSHIHRFVSFGGEPVSVPDGIITQVKEYEGDAYSLPQREQSIPHEFAEVLLLEDPLMRNYALLNYLASRNLQHAS